MSGEPLSDPYLLTLLMLEGWLKGRAATEPKQSARAPDSGSGEEREAYIIKQDAPTLRTVGADIVFLYSVLQWAELQRDAAGRPLIERNPIRGYQRPKTLNPRRPVASYDRFLKLRAKADEVDSQGLFGSFLDLVEGLGWRVSAICRLWASDVDLQRTATAPHGRIRKR